jgi:hypothetical protein
MSHPVVVLGLRRRADSRAEEPVRVRSLVRVITSEDELRDAVERAARFERMVIERMQTRARRYEDMVAPTLISPAPITGITSAARGVPMEPVEGDTPRSA